MNSKIITIQYQQLDQQTGKPLEPLTILKEWESSEKEILEKVRDQGIIGNVKEKKWKIIPVGYNLDFEYKFLARKFDEYFGIESSIENWLEKPKKDLKLIGIVLNKGTFKGATLSNFTKKLQNGENVPIWYNNKKYDMILEYIINETESFIEFWQKLNYELPRLYKKN